MSTITQAVRLKTAFLQEAAKSITITSPSTAAYLGSESIQQALASEPHNKVFTEPLRQTFCTACGSVFVPGWNCSIIRGNKGSATDKLKTIQRRTIVYHCQACYHRTTFRVPSIERLDSKIKAKNVSRSTILDVDAKLSVSSNPGIVLAKASSKKRAKVRREKAGLRSLLKKSKEEAATSPQFNLMDLMMP